MQKVLISLIIPAYNEGGTFEKNVSLIVKQLKKLGKQCEIIFVEDKSLDETRKGVRRMVSRLKNSQAIYHSRNQGRGKSVTDGILSSKAEICGFLDVDLEVSADYIPLFIREVENGKDIVVGCRFYGGEGPRALLRFLASKIYALSVKLFFNSPIKDTECGYKFFRRKKILPILSKVKSKHWFWDTEICIRSVKSGLNISQIPVLFRRRDDKKSTVRLFRDSFDYISNLIKLKKELVGKE